MTSQFGSISAWICPTNAVDTPSIDADSTCFSPRCTGAPTRLMATIAAAALVKIGRVTALIPKMSATECMSVTSLVPT